MTVARFSESTGVKLVFLGQNIALFSASIDDRISTGNYIYELRKVLDSTFSYVEFYIYDRPQWSYRLTATVG